MIIMLLLTGTDGLLKNSDNSLMIIFPSCNIIEAKYAKLIDLIKHFSAEEIVQVSDKSGGFADQSLFTRIANGKKIKPQNNLLSVFATMKVANTVSNISREVDEIVDSYLMDYVIRPPFPKILTIIASQIIRYNLYKDGNLEEDATINKRYKESLLKLEKIHSGQLYISGLEQYQKVEFTSSRKSVWS